MDTNFETSKDNYNDEWLTPPEIIKDLGKFDLDPCSPINRPWNTAEKHFNINDMGLMQNWFGRVWLNPPYNESGLWLEKLAFHGNGIALIFCRTDTDFFHRVIFKKANGIFFIKGRLKFLNVKGEISKNSAGSPSCLISFGENNCEVLKNFKVKKGCFIKIN